MQQHSVSPKGFLDYEIGPTHVMMTGIWIGAIAKAENIEFPNLDLQAASMSTTRVC